MANTMEGSPSDLLLHTSSKSDYRHYKLAHSAVAAARKKRSRKTSERQKIFSRESSALRYFEPFVKPLLEIPGSTYRHSFLDPNDWQSYQRIFDLGLIKPEKAPVGPNQLDQPNDSLLLVGNFAEVLAKPLFGFESTAHMAVHHFVMAAARSHSHIHANGLVRILLWILDEDKKNIVPQDVSERGILAYQMDKSGSTTVVASSGKPSSDIGFNDTEMRHAQRVAKTMNRNGMKPPQNRETLEYQKACDYLAHAGKVEKAPGNQATKENNLSLRWEGDKELSRLEKAFSADDIEKDKKSVREKHPDERPSSSRLRFMSNDPRLERLYRLRHHSSIIKESYQKLNGLVILDEELLQLELAIASGDLSDNDKEKLTKEMQTKLAELKTKQSRLGKTEQSRLAHLGDNQRARNREQSLLQWDRRAFEPLTTGKHESFPSEHLALLDLQPKPHFTFSTDNQSDDKEWEPWFITKLFMNPNLPLPKCLETCAPGAAAALIPQAPSVTDPAKGGRLDVSLLHVRLLTLEMVDELLKAWIDWPFRPSLDQSTPIRLRQDRRRRK
ncbi:MAG: hypothetical protein Q9157_002986 [Trypethelium eluteriae]